MNSPSTSPKPFVFVLMPFDSSFDDVYKLGIREACQTAGAYTERVDEQVFDERISDRIYNQIAKADIIVADMSGRNPNVFYEVGYAHALNKRVFLLTNNADDIPFDLKHHPHIVYGDSISTLLRELKKKIRWAIDNPQKHTTTYELPLKIQINGVNLENNPKISVINERHYVNADLFKISVLNSIERLVKPIALQFQLFSPKNLQVISFNQAAYFGALSLDKTQNVFLIDQPFTILPGATFPIEIILREWWDMQREYLYEFKLRILTENHPIDFPFQASFKMTWIDK